jgi:hypothetical protein
MGGMKSHTITGYAELEPELSFSDWRQEILSRLDEDEPGDEQAVLQLRRAS